MPGESSGISFSTFFRVNQQEADPDIGFLEYFPFANFSEWANDFNSSQEYLQVLSFLMFEFFISIKLI